jgi:urease accessory protein
MRAVTSAAIATRVPPGEGWLRFERVDGETAIVASRATSPLQLLAPRRRGACAWAVLSSHGGGLVGGDAVSLDVEAGPGAVAAITTQAETKVYRCAGGRSASQRLRARVAAGAALAWVPDPVSPFAGARYEQRQDFDLAAGASLLAVDEVVAGRTARGERWTFDRYATRTEVRVDGRLALGDALVLAASPALASFDAFALVLAIGPAFDACARAMQEEAEALGTAAGAALLAAASPVEGGAIVRCAARTPAALAAFVRRVTAPAAALVGGETFHRW